MATLVKRRFVRPPEPLVMKFGGTSVGSPAGWTQIIRRIGQVKASGRPSIVVLSALSGVTDLLEQLSHRLTQEQPQGVATLVETIAQRHGDLGQQLELEPTSIVVQTREMLRDAIMRAKADEDASVRVLATGEQLACTFAKNVLARHRVDAVHKPSTKHLIRTTAASESNARFELRGCAAGRPTDVWVMEGYSVGTADGGVALLGRGGSDQSATLLAELVGASSCEIWSDVDGFYTDDPRRVATARRYATLSYSAAESLALNGAKVMQAAALEPARRAGIPVVIKSTFAPSAGQTVISDDAPGQCTLANIANVTETTELGL